MQKPVNSFKFGYNTKVKTKRIWHKIHRLKPSSIAKMFYGLKEQEKQPERAQNNTLTGNIQNVDYGRDMELQKN